MNQRIRNGWIAATFALLSAACGNIAGPGKPQGFEVPQITGRSQVAPQSVPGVTDSPLVIRNTWEPTNPNALDFRVQYPISPHYTFDATRRTNAGETPVDLRQPVDLAPNEELRTTVRMHTEFQITDSFRIKTAVIHGDGSLDPWTETKIEVRPHQVPGVPSGSLWGQRFVPDVDLSNLVDFRGIPFMGREFVVGIAGAEGIQVVDLETLESLGVLDVGDVKSAAVMISGDDEVIAIVTQQADGGSRSWTFEPDGTPTNNGTTGPIHLVNTLYAASEPITTPSGKILVASQDTLRRDVGMGQFREFDPEPPHPDFEFSFVGTASPGAGISGFALDLAYDRKQDDVYALFGGGIPIGKQMTKTESLVGAPLFHLFADVAEDQNRILISGDHAWTYALGISSSVTLFGRDSELCLTDKVTEFELPATPISGSLIPGKDAVAYVLDDFTVTICVVHPTTHEITPLNLDVSAFMSKPSTITGIQAGSDVGVAVGSKEEKVYAFFRLDF